MIANFKKETKVEIDYKIELPYFCKSITSYYKIIDEQTAIKVEYWDVQYYSIAVVSASMALNCGDQQCNSEDFYLALQQVSSYINHKANE